MDDRKPKSFFQGYTAVRLPGTDKKKGKIQRIYTGTYYVMNVTDQEWIWKKVLYSVLGVMVLGVYILCAIIPNGYNLAKYVALPEAISLWMLLWYGKSLIHYVSGSRKLTVYEYGITSEKIINSSRASGVFLGITAAAVLINFLLRIRELPWMNLAGAAGFAACSAGMLFLNYQERSVKYRKEESEEPLPEDSLVIGDDI